MVNPLRAVLLREAQVVQVNKSTETLLGQGCPDRHSQAQT